VERQKGAEKSAPFFYVRPHKITALIKTLFCGANVAGKKQRATIELRETSAANSPYHLQNQ
jgi:hypothetical protein